MNIKLQAAIIVGGAKQFQLTVKSEEIYEKSSEVQVKVGFSVKDLATALRELSDEDREFFIENLLAATSPEYLESISEARRDYEEGIVIPYEEVFKS